MVEGAYKVFDLGSQTSLVGSLGVLVAELFVAKLHCELPKFLLYRCFVKISMFLKMFLLKIKKREL